MELNEFSGDKDMANKRDTILDGTKVILERYDPYGFVRIIWDNGETPSTFVGANFTSFDEARKALESYQNDLKNKKKE